MQPLICPYNTEWPRAFEALQTRLAEVLAGCDIQFEHVGSTAVPGMPAKPILDIDLVLVANSLPNALAAKLEAVGYVNRGEQGIAGRFAFRQSEPQTPATVPPKLWQAHHLYVCFADSLALKNHLLFRDALLQDAALAARYAQLKYALWQEAGMTRERYAQRKTDFIVGVLGQMGLSPGELQAITQANT